MSLLDRLRELVAPTPAQLEVRRDAAFARGRALFFDGKFREAERELGRAVQAGERLGALDAKLVLARAERARALVQLGDYPEAEEVARSALRLAETVAGRRSAEAAVALTRLGWALSSRDQLDEAGKVLAEALATREALLGPGHPDVAESHWSLAGLAVHRRDAALVRRHAERAIAILDPSLPADPSPEEAHGLAWPHTYLAEAALLEEDGALAERHARRALELRERASLRLHPWTARGVVLVAVSLHFRGRTREAWRLASEGLASFERACGPAHFALVAPLSSLGHMALTLGAPDRALALFERALAITTARGETGHRGAIWLELGLGEALAASGDFRRAVPLLERMVERLERREELAGHVPRARSALADALAASGKLEEAIAQARRALELSEAKRPSEAPELLAPRLALARHLRAAGRTDEARAVLERAVALVEREASGRGWLPGQALFDLAAVRRDQDALPEAEALVRRALSLFEASLGAEHPLVLGAVSALADVLDDQGRSSEADALHERAAAIETSVWTKARGRRR